MKIPSHPHLSKLSSGIKHQKHLVQTSWRRRESMLENFLNVSFETIWVIIYDDYDLFAFRGERFSFLFGCTVLVTLPFIELYVYLFVHYLDSHRTKQKSWFPYMVDPNNEDLLIVTFFSPNVILLAGLWQVDHNYNCPLIYWPFN